MSHQPSVGVAAKDKQNRANVKYVAIPLDLWQEIKDFADQDERSVTWATKHLLRKALRLIQEEEDK